MRWVHLLGGLAVLGAGCVGPGGNAETSPAAVALGGAYQVMKATGVADAMAADAANKKASEVAMLQLRVGEAPPGGVEAYLAKYAPRVRLETRKDGKAELKYRDSHNCLPWFTGAELKDGRVTRINPKCLHACAVSDGRLWCNENLAKGQRVPY